MSFTEGRKVLAVSSNSVKIKLCPDLGFQHFQNFMIQWWLNLFFYVAGVWGFKDTADSNAIQSRAARCFLGVHKYTAKMAIEGDTGWESCLVKKKCDWTPCPVTFRLTKRIGIEHTVPLCCNILSYWFTFYFLEYKEYKQYLTFFLLRLLILVKLRRHYTNEQ